MNKQVKFLLALTTFLTTTIFLFGQDYNFKVMTTRGDNELLDAAALRVKLRVGALVNDGDAISLSPNGYVLLVSPTNGVVELQSAEQKKYEVSDLQVEGSEESLLLKYSNYVIGKMSPEVIEANRKKYASITGATERGIEAITLYMATSADVLNNMVVIRWEYPGNNASYVVEFRDMFEKLLDQRKTDVPYMIVDLDAEEFAGQDLVTVNVKLDGNENISSGAHAMQRLTEEDASGYFSDYMELKSSLGESPFSHLILAEFFEQNGLLLDALTSYEAAVEESQGLDYFRVAYLGFLMRNGYTDKTF